MTEVNFEELSDALQQVSDSPQWERSLKSIRNYVENPTKSFAPNVSKATRILAEFGRINPEGLEKLLELVYKVKFDTVDIDAYVQAHEEEIEKAFAYLSGLQRPGKTIGSLIDSGGDLAKAKLTVLRGEKLILAVLLPIIRTSVTKFAEMVDRKLIVHRLAKQKEGNAYQKEYMHRFRGRQAIMLYINRSKVLTPKMENELRVEKEKTKEALKVFLEEKVKEGMKAIQARKEFWKLYDEELQMTLDLIEREKKGARIRREFVRFPTITNKYLPQSRKKISCNKLEALSKKFNKK